MNTAIYLYKGKHLCALVESEEGNKFIENVERFCTNWQMLIEEAKTGFSGFSFYDRYKNGDVPFWGKYEEELYGENENNYECLGWVENGRLDFRSDTLKGKGEYFSELARLMEIADNYHCDVYDFCVTEDYIVLSSDCDVLVCSNIKVPFEPKGKAKDLRDAVRKGLSLLEEKENEFLTAYYGSEKSEFCDLENALFYNIGTSSFKKALSRETSLHFERIQPNEVSRCDEMNFKYVYRWSVFSWGKGTRWWEKNLVCEWNKIPLEKVNSSSKATDYFLSIKNHFDNVKCYQNAEQEKLGMKICLFVPKNAKFENVANVMKPMIDGVICAFHKPRGINAEEIGRLLGLDKKLFLSEENTCLGECSYISAYRNGAKWNPKDERLDVVEIDVETVEEDIFSYSGKIFAIPCYM